MAYSPLVLLDRFIIEGYHFDDLPGNWMALHSDGFGVRRQSYESADNGRIVTVQKKPHLDNLSFADKRKISTQAYQVTWQQPRSVMGRCMYDHLSTLYSLQKGFYLQFDEVMTYDPSVPAHLNNFGVNTRAYFTPTYPIKPFGWTPSAPTTWDRCVFINNRPVDPTSFTVDEDSGCIQFRAQLLSTDIVSAIYTWRMYVQIADFSVVPGPEEVAQEFYVGTVTFEQVKKPTGTPDLWLVTPPCVDPAGLSFSGAVLSLPSQAIQPSEYISFGNFTSDYTWGDTVSLDSGITSPTNSAWSWHSGMSPLVSDGTAGTP